MKRAKYGDERSPYVNPRGDVFTRDKISACVRSLIGVEHLGFAGYMTWADALCVRVIGLSVFDLPDCAWRVWYDERVPVNVAVRRCIAAR